MPPSERDEATYMWRALQLAARGQGAVEPNPMVGCVIFRGGRIIAEGYHRKFGGPHAEVEALRKCGERARGATVYVTLEPCSYHGKTPPCTDALIRAGVRRVVAAMNDPNPKVNGQGLQRLKEAGIETAVGLLEPKARDLNAPFIKLVRQKRPWVILKWAQSLDGKIATRTGDAKWISDDRMRNHAHRVRGRIDGIIVGVQTAIADDPMLTCRAGKPRRIAKRVVLDTNLNLPLDASLICSARKYPVWIFCREDPPASRARILESAGCVLFRTPTDENGLDLGAVLDQLGKKQLTNIVVEGGGKLLGRFFDARLGDELHVYLAPLLIGGQEAVGALEGQGPGYVRDAVKLPGSNKLVRIGSGWFLKTRLAKSRAKPTRKSEEARSGSATKR